MDKHSASAVWLGSHYGVNIVAYAIDASEDMISEWIRGYIGVTCLFWHRAVTVLGCGTVVSPLDDDHMDP